MGFLKTLKSWLSRTPDRAEPSTPVDGAQPSTSMISCEEALRVVYEYLDGELPASSYVRVKEHFDVCARCYPMLRFEESFRIAVRGAATRERAPSELRDSMLRALAEARSDD